MQQTKQPSFSFWQSWPLKADILIIFTWYSLDVNSKNLQAKSTNTTILFTCGRCPTLTENFFTLTNLLVNLCLTFMAANRQAILSRTLKSSHGVRLSYQRNRPMPLSSRETEWTNLSCSYHRRFTRICHWTARHGRLFPHTKKKRTVQGLDVQKTVLYWTITRLKQEYIHA